MARGESRVESIELTWSLVPQALCGEIREAGEGEPLRACIKQNLEGAIARGIPLDANNADEQVDIVVDMLFHCALFCLEEGFDDGRLSTVLSILWEVHRESMIERYSMKEALQTLEHWIVQHSVHRPPQTVLLFNLADVKAIHHYCLSTYFRHYKLYERAFTPARVLTLRSRPEKVVVAQPAAFRPLRAAVKEEPAPAADGEAADGAVDGTAPGSRAGSPAPAEEPAAPTPTDEGLAAADTDGAAANTGADPIASDAVNSLKQPRGLKKQLESISNETATLSKGKLDALESRIEELEAKQEAAKNVKGKKK